MKNVQLCYREKPQVNKATELPLLAATAIEYSICLSQ